MKLISLLVAASATIVMGNEYICETSDGSPYLHHVRAWIDNLRGDGIRFCYPQDADMCSRTERISDSGAGIQFCGGGFHCSTIWGDQCASGCYPERTAVADEIQTLYDTCVKEGDERLGGKIKYNAGNGDGEIRIYSLPGR